MNDIQKYINMMLNYRDQFGMITQRDRDGGDTAQRTGLYYSLLKLAGIQLTDRFEPTEDGYEQDMKMLEVQPGLYHRHPDPLKWYSNVANFSRDQQIILMGAMILLDDKLRFKDLIDRLKARHYFHQNTYPNGCGPGDEKYKWKVPDFITPMEASLIIRSKDKLSILDKAKLLFLDAFMFLDDKLAKKNGWDAYNMTCVLHMICNRIHPTFLSKLVWKKLDKITAKAQIRYYYRENNNNGIFPLGEIYCQIIDQES